MLDTFGNFIHEALYEQFKKAGQFLSETGHTAYLKYSERCEKFGRQYGSLVGGRWISKERSEYLVAQSLKVLPIALGFLAFTPTLSMTSLAMAAAVSVAAVNIQTLSRESKVKVLEGASLAIALETLLSVGYCLLHFSPISAVGTLLIGSLAGAVALHSAHRSKV